MNECMPWHAVQVLRGDYLVVYGASDGGVANKMPDVAAFVQQDFTGAEKCPLAEDACKLAQNLIW